MPKSSIMLLAVWMFPITITWSSWAQASPAPPLAAALSQPSQVFPSSNTDNDSVDLSEKELGNFFFPGSQTWIDSVDDFYRLSKEGSNRGFDGRNYLRFGRSVDRHNNSTPSPRKVDLMTRAERDASAVHHVNSPELGEITSQRMKRGAPSIYVSLPSHSPSAWARDIRPEDKIINVASYEDLQDINKRRYKQGLPHFDSDNNFLRFGKRDQSAEFPASSSSEYSGSMLILRPVRVPLGNFIRFG
ncbi:uncharacterized protein [Cherax quadricarinatus]|uniref:uncharacterized protein n=1 Tax=Cherax quadricarinatus TaxID=27406 RepID=UPI00237864C0|nr:uncharacterized protein LOC128703649 [Cherax quadricarinatus]